jgi:hypothetical protein
MMDTMGETRWMRARWEMGVPNNITTIQTMMTVRITILTWTLVGISASELTTSLIFLMHKVVYRFLAYYTTSGSKHLGSIDVVRQPIFPFVPFFHICKRGKQKRKRNFFF